VIAIDYFRVFPTEQTVHYHRTNISIMSVSHHNNNGNGNPETVLFDKLQGFSSSLRRERDDAYRQNQLAGERCSAVQEEWTALQKTVTDLQEKLEGLQEGEKLKGEIETTKQKTHALKQQVNTRTVGIEYTTTKSRVQSHWRYLLV
jgi:peptidoglycan hydrolase CwlO-like protein